MSGIVQWAKNVEAYSFQAYMTMPYAVTPGNTLVILMGTPYPGEAPTTWYDVSADLSNNNFYNLIPGSDVGDAFPAYVCLNCANGGDRIAYAPYYGIQTWWIEIEGVYAIDVASLPGWGGAPTLSLATTAPDLIAAIAWAETSASSDPPGQPGQLVWNEEVKWAIIREQHETRKSGTGRTKQLRNSVPS